ncbi:hypothetical protein CC1G_03884 [Coprinopsis cinerea okayama7|uniref:Uncharacterized protein n=1 Tax=Coprinopsis cinerea (strain Okayama-7 / 130 / ATCC MYA-4618 / FGSC 9003) TaxID=240176 RepID=A8NH32_COPC7|nr:hypothetical protein CC1G_03884 [Coprinopsis cinerea okayama7\|eukprot:XP_001833667.1 hypothetical protein CC1G_03884 [Coprinopsis cinerea okayama7\
MSNRLLTKLFNHKVRLPHSIRTPLPQLTLPEFEPLQVPDSKTFDLDESGRGCGIPSHITSEVPVEIYIRIFQMAAEADQTCYLNLLLTSKAVHSTVHRKFLPTIVVLKEERQIVEFIIFLQDNELEWYRERIRHLWVEGLPADEDSRALRKGIILELLRGVKNLESLACGFCDFLVLCETHDHWDPPPNAGSGAYPNHHFPEHFSTHSYPYLKELVILDRFRYRRFTHFSLPKQITRLTLLDPGTSSFHCRQKIVTHFPAMDSLALEIWTTTPFKGWANQTLFNGMWRNIIDVNADYPWKRVVLTSENETVLCGGGYVRNKSGKGCRCMFKIGKVEHLQRWKERASGMGLEGIWENPGSLS